MKKKIPKMIYMPVKKKATGVREFVLDSHGKARMYTTQAALERNVPADKYDLVYIFECFEILKGEKQC